MYIVSYISKAERTLGQLLTAPQTEARQDNNYDAVKELRHLGRVYMTHREVSYACMCSAHSCMFVICPFFSEDDYAEQVVCLDTLH